MYAYELTKFHMIYAVHVWVCYLSIFNSCGHSSVAIYVCVSFSFFHLKNILSSIVSWLGFCLFGVVTLYKINMKNPRKEVNAVLKKEAAYFGDIVILPFMDRYELVVLKTIAICEFGVSFCIII